MRDSGDTKRPFARELGKAAHAACAERSSKPTGLLALIASLPALSPPRGPSCRPGGVGEGGDQSSAAHRALVALICRRAGRPAVLAEWARVEISRPAHRAFVALMCSNHFAEEAGAVNREHLGQPSKGPEPRDARQDEWDRNGEQDAECRKPRSPSRHAVVRACPSTSTDEVVHACEHGPENFIGCEAHRQADEGCREHPRS